MVKTTVKRFSYAALVCSLFPALSYLLVICKVPIVGDVQTALAGLNILCALLGLGLSIVCIKGSAARRTVNIVSMIISIIWILMIATFLELALILSLIQ